MTLPLHSFSRFGVWVLSLLLLLGSSLLAQAQAIRYVRTDGTNANPATATTWASGTTNLQGAINASAAGDQVWVVQGTYKPTTSTDRTISFAMKNGVAMIRTNHRHSLIIHLPNLTPYEITFTCSAVAAG